MTRAERQLCRQIDGAVACVLNAHPEYVTEAGRRHLASSIAKRLSGQLLALARQHERHISGEIALSPGHRTGNLNPAVENDVQGDCLASPPERLASLRRVFSKLVLWLGRDA